MKNKYNTTTIFTTVEKEQLAKLDNQLLFLNVLYNETKNYEKGTYAYNSLNKTQKILGVKYNANRHKLNHLIEKRIINENIQNQGLSAERIEFIHLKKREKEQNFWNNI